VCLIFLNQPIVHTHVDQNFDSCLADGITAVFISWEFLFFKQQNFAATFLEIVRAGSAGRSRSDDGYIIECPILVGLGAKKKQISRTQKIKK